MGSKLQEVHQNNMISQKKEWQCLETVRKESEIFDACILSWRVRGLSWVVLVFQVARVLTLVHIYDCVCGSNFSSPFLFTLSMVMFLASFQLLNLTSALCKPKRILDTHVSGFSVCSCVLFPLSELSRLPQSYLYSDFGHESIYWLS